MRQSDLNRIFYGSFRAVIKIYGLISSVREQSIQIYSYPLEGRIHAAERHYYSALCVGIMILPYCRMSHPSWRNMSF